MLKEIFEHILKVRDFDLTRHTRRIAIALGVTPYEVYITFDILHASTGIERSELCRAVEQCVVASKELGTDPQSVANLFRELLGLMGKEGR